MKKIIAFSLVISMVFCQLALGASTDTQVLDTTAQYLRTTVANPTVATIGGEWTVLGLARYTGTSSDYFNKYYSNLETLVKETSGILHTRKYTEYSRVVLTLTALGRDPRNVAGYNLLAPLGDYDKVILQGINGPIFALLALDSGEYATPQGTGSRQKYVNYILSKQLADGGFALSGSVAEADTTAMAIQALAGYTKDPQVKAAVARGISSLSTMQNATAGYGLMGLDNLESTAQVLMAMVMADVSVADPRFTKNGKTIVDNMLLYRSQNAFTHGAGDTQINLMATDQAFCALVALWRKEQGKAGFYSMGDVTNTATTPPLKNPDVAAPSKITPPTCTDIQGHKNQTAIQTLMNYGIINGREGGAFAPDDTISRSEFAQIIVKSLGLTREGTASFIDLEAGKWYNSTAKIAAGYDIVRGSQGRFLPNDKITREEAAVMVARSSKLAGQLTEKSGMAAEKSLMSFDDFSTCADWSVEALAFCYDTNILTPTGQNIYPKEQVTRGQVAQMVYNMLTSADLIVEG